MSGKTHGIAAIAASITIIHPCRPETALLGAGMSFLGGMLPDTDQYQSKAGKKISRLIVSSFSLILLLIFMKQAFHFDLGSYLPIRLLASNIPSGFLLFFLLCSMGLNTGHRTFTHSFLGGGLFTLCIYLCFPSYWQYFFIGYATHLFLDFFNKEGMELFFPIGKRISIPLCRSGNIYINALIVLASVALLAFYLLWILRLA